MTNPIHDLVTELEQKPLWQNGVAPTIPLPESASPEDVVRQSITVTGFDEGHIQEYKIISVQNVNISNATPPAHKAALINSDLGKKIILFRYENTSKNWWTRVFDID